MSMRTYSLAALSLLAASCGKVEPTPTKSPLAGVASGSSGSGGIDCARGNGSTLKPACSIERTPTQDGVVLTIRYPDGGFRRLRVTGDGKGVVAADGAETARVTVTGPHEIEVAIADDRYRLPASIGRAPGQTAP